MKIQSRPAPKPVTPSQRDISAFIMNAIAFEPSVNVAPAARGVLRTMVAMGFITSFEIHAILSSRELVVYLQPLGDTELSLCDIINF